MPDSMFDKLGDLLNEALESGEIPQYTQKAGTPEMDNDVSASATGAVDRLLSHPSSPMTKQERAAFQLLGISAEANRSEARRRYHEQLQRFHPDKQGEDDAQQEAARRQTIQLMQAWEAVDAYLRRDGRS